jgi:hypothetical protein
MGKGTDGGRYHETERQKEKQYSFPSCLVGWFEAITEGIIYNARVRKKCVTLIVHRDGLES